MLGRKGFWGGFITGSLLGFILGMISQPHNKPLERTDENTSFRERGKRASGIIRYHRS
ncbi:hypothetical protein SAMN00808754_2568 [Thermanaeromonas toyohensis ToBE]|uniref:Uncharacterized protein n=1 Tax=Thermanaeromonas toyohensis ToBE TaxID=698762 RepID=A0A1W1VZY6_9FIRM|nr:hypothetical protein SAMN00808754_2568 [Thermanaeromonas toyohensis ToBE]